MSFGDLWTPEQGGQQTGLDLLNSIEGDPSAYQQLLNDLRRDLQLDASTDLVTGSVLSALVDKRTGSSAFLQLVTAGSLKIQYYNGAGTLASGATLGPVGNTITLPTAWPNHHFLFIASVTAGPQWPSYYSGQATDLAHGGIILSTASAVTATFGYQWISLGN